MLRVDHILVAARNHLSTAEQLLGRAGLASVDGGWFPDEGLAQLVVPLGNDQYLEIEGLVDLDLMERPASTTEYFLDAVKHGDVLAGWWVWTDDLEGVCHRLGTTVYETNKRHPDSWVACGRGTPASIDALSRGLPGFWMFDDPTRHPGRRVAAHRNQPNGIAWVEVGGDARELAAWLGPEGDDLPLRFVEGPPGLHGIGIATDNGAVVIRPGARSLDITLDS